MRATFNPDLRKAAIDLIVSYLTKHPDGVLCADLWKLNTSQNYSQFSSLLRSMRKQGLIHNTNESKNTLYFIGAESQESAPQEKHNTRLHNALKKIIFSTLKKYNDIDIDVLKTEIKFRLEDFDVAFHDRAVNSYLQKLRDDDLIECHTSGAIQKIRIAQKAAVETDSVHPVMRHFQGFQNIGEYWIKYLSKASEKTNEEIPA